MIGMRFSRLVVIENSIEKPTHCLCKCDCGKIKLIAKASLKYNRTKSCGCLHKEKISEITKKLRGINENDFIGQKFSRLTVKSVNGKDEYGQWNYLCICDCGKERDISRVGLISGRSQSCGCLNSELTAERLIKRHSEDQSYLDFIGQKFGMLTVTDRYEELNNDGRYEFLCECECGKETKVLKSNLVAGRTLSCGCYNSELLREKFREYRRLKGYNENIPLRDIIEVLRSNTGYLVRDIIIELDKKRCVMCSSLNNLHIHHIEPVSYFLNLNDKNTYNKLYDSENLICLCKNCHKKAHNNEWKDLDLDIKIQLIRIRKDNPINSILKNKYIEIVESTIVKFINNFNYKLINLDNQLCQ
jgi:hypothetical protein